MPNHRLGAPFLVSPPPLAHARGFGRRGTPADLGFGLLAAAAAAGLVAIDLYALAWSRTGHHTGLPVMGIAWGLGGLALVGAFGVGWARGGGPVRPGLAWLLLVIGLAGFLDVALLERRGVLVESGERMERGRAERRSVSGAAPG